MVDDASMGQCMLCVNKGNNDAPGFQKIVFRVSYKLQLYCVWIGFVLCRFDFFLFSLLPIMVKIPLMSHSSVPFSHTRTNCDRVRNIKFLTSLASFGRYCSLDRPCLWQKIVGMAPSSSLGLSTTPNSELMRVRSLKLLGWKCLECSQQGVHFRGPQK